MYKTSIMIKINTIVCSILCLFTFLSLGAQDTFSIVAVDEETGEIGSAGASCVDNANAFGGVIIISGILPGRGAINGQATVCIPHINLQTGMNQMSLGKSPDEVLEYLFNNDGCQFGNNTNRQYGVVDFDPAGAPRSAAYTGVNCLSHAGHRTGPNYAIQGNILLGPAILDSMEARFLASEGPLAKRLMAAMQGANVPGADSRCMDEGTSSKSAFLQVAKPDDTAGNFSLVLNVQLTPDGVEPIDSLQVLFDAWFETINSTNEPEQQQTARIFPNPTAKKVMLEWFGATNEKVEVTLTDVAGKQLMRQAVTSGINEIILPKIPQGQVLILHVENETGVVLFSEKLIVRPE